MPAEGIAVSAVVVFFLLWFRNRGQHQGRGADGPEVGSRRQFWHLINPASLTLVAMTAAIGAIAVADEEYATAGLAFVALIGAITLRLVLVSRSR